jgi:hypothetical protein
MPVIGISQQEYINVPTLIQNSGLLLKSMTSSEINSS